MIYFVGICLLALAAAARANAPLGLGLGGLGGLGLGHGGLAVSSVGVGIDPTGSVYAPGHASADYYAYPKYAFDYAVNDPHTGDNKAQWEKRDGDVVKGAYSLVEPDGSLRVVEYWADDKSGFNAVVKRIGKNLHPTGPIAPLAPLYKAPIPLLSGGPIGIAPLSVGPIAHLGGLANAPLVSGPWLGHGAVSQQTLIKNELPIVKTLAPILAEPIKGPLLTAPLIKGPLLSGPIGPWGPSSIREPINVLGGDKGLSSWGAPGLGYKAPLSIIDNGLLTKDLLGPLPLGPIGPVGPAWGAWGKSLGSHLY